MCWHLIFLHFINNSYFMWLLKMFIQICWICLNVCYTLVWHARTYRTQHIYVFSIHNWWHWKWIGIISLMYCMSLSLSFSLCVCMQKPSGFLLILCVPLKLFKSVWKNQKTSTNIVSTSVCMCVCVCVVSVAAGASIGIHIEAILLIFFFLLYKLFSL